MVDRSLSLLTQMDGCDISQWASSDIFVEVPKPTDTWRDEISSLVG